MLCVLYERVSSRRRWIEVVKKCESLRQLFLFYFSSFSSSFNSTSAWAVSCSLGFAKATLLCHIWRDFVFHFKCMRVYRPIHGSELRSFLDAAHIFSPRRPKVLVGAVECMRLTVNDKRPRNLRQLHLHLVTVFHLCNNSSAASTTLHTHSLSEADVSSVCTLKSWSDVDMSRGLKVKFNEISSCSADFLVFRLTKPKTASGSREIFPQRTLNFAAIC